MAKAKHTEIETSNDFEVLKNKTIEEFTEYLKTNVGESSEEVIQLFHAFINK
jgi:hypothetical protein